VRAARSKWIERMTPETITPPTDPVLEEIRGNAAPSKNLDVYIDGVVARCKEASLFLKNPLV